MVVGLLILAYCFCIHLSFDLLFQVWHAVSRDRKPIRKRYLEAILPPFVAVLRRWRPLLAGIHELAIADGLNPLTVDDPALAADALPLEVGQFYMFLSSLPFCLPLLLQEFMKCKLVIFAF